VVVREARLLGDLGPDDSSDLKGTGVVRWTARGFAHPEERARPVAPGRFELESATHGDADELELELGSLAEATIQVRATVAGFDGWTAARIDWEVPGSDLLRDGVRRRELEGVDLFLCVERLTAQALPLTLSGEISVAPDPGGTRAVYLFARELGDAKVWTSPLFITDADASV
jgi:hypothetical protein